MFHFPTNPYDVQWINEATPNRPKFVNTFLCLKITCKTWKVPYLRLVRPWWIIILPSITVTRPSLTIILPPLNQPFSTNPWPPLPRSFIIPATLGQPDQCFRWKIQKLVVQDPDTLHLSRQLTHGHTSHTGGRTMGIRGQTCGWWWDKMVVSDD